MDAGTTQFYMLTSMHNVMNCQQTSRGLLVLLILNEVIHVFSSINIHWDLLKKSMTHTEPQYSPQKHDLDNWTWMVTT